MVMPKETGTEQRNAFLLLRCQWHVTGHKAIFGFHHRDNEVGLIVALGSPRRQADKPKVR